MRSSGIGGNSVGMAPGICKNRPGTFQRERTSHYPPAAVVTTCLIPSRKRQQHTTKASAWLTGWQQTNCRSNQAWSRRHLVVSLRGLFPRLTAAVSGLNLDRPFCTSYFTCQVHCQSRRVVAASNNSCLANDAADTV